MSGGILALFGLCLGAAVLDIALPGEDKNSPKQLLGFFVALAVVILILHPILRLPDTIGAFSKGDLLFSEEVDRSDYEQVLSDALAARSRQELERGVAALLEREFGLSLEQCDVCASLDDAGELLCIDVRLRGSGLLQDPLPIEKRLTDLFACETEVR